MNYFRATMALAALGLSLKAQATEGSASPEQFAGATASCFKALAAATPSNVLTSVEANGWKLRQTTPLGGIFRQEGNSVEMKIETIFSSRVCTVLGNRDAKLPLSEMSQLVETSLRSVITTGLRRDATRSDFTLVAEEKYKAVITAQQSGTTFNTQITTIAI